MNGHIRTIINKEWAEVFKNRMVIFTTILIPLIFTALPLVMLGVMGPMTAETSSAAADVPQEFLKSCGGLSGGECIQVYLVNQSLILFLMMPVILPVTFAAYSIVGEKTTRSLEPLLATPITTAELLAGKSLAAAIPAIGATWLSFFLFCIDASNYQSLRRRAFLCHRTDLVSGRAGGRTFDGGYRGELCFVHLLTGERPTGG